MRLTKRNISGLTLVEVMLVLAVAATITVMGFRLYEVNRRDAYLREIMYNVNTLALAASHYYYANCGFQNGNVPGALNPLNTSSPLTFSNSNAPNVTYSVNINNDLINNGYLTANITPNPYVQSYTVQFNSISPYFKTATVCADPACTSTTTKKLGLVVNWQIQVGVILNPSIMSLGKTYAGYLQADCLTTLGNDGTLIACSQNDSVVQNCPTLRYWAQSNSGYGQIAGQMNCPQSNVYGSSSYNNAISFTRPPSSPTSLQQAGIGWNAAGLNFFDQQYNTYSTMTLITNSNNPQFPEQYFLCGS